MLLQNYPPHFSFSSSGQLSRHVVDKPKVEPPLGGPETHNLFQVRGLKDDLMWEMEGVEAAKPG